MRFQTKTELAIQMLERMWQAQIPIAWMVADTVLAARQSLRNWLEAHDYPYVLAVAAMNPWVS